MKKKLFTLLLALVAIATTGRAQNKINGHEYVDLGLPSGTLWATCNVGATKPEEYGDYFAWGETDPKDDYDFFKNYKYFDINITKGFTKYTNSDGKKELEQNDDAAYVKWGNSWCIPSYDQIIELYENCNYKPASLNGVNGYYFTSNKNGRSIFFPYSGYYDGNQLKEVGTVGYFWTRTISMISTAGEDFAHTLYMSSSHSNMYVNHRYKGLAIRPVAKALTTPGEEEEDIPTPAEAIDLGLPSGTLWASFNVGATKPEEYGHYFAWGETEPKDYYGWTDYKYADVTEEPNGTVDRSLVHDIGDDISGTSYDVAHTRWGNGWRMPNEKQANELVALCSWEESQLNGTKGYRVTGPNGKSIFLPSSGEYGDGIFWKGLSYWTSTISSNMIDYATFIWECDKSNIQVASHARCVGKSIRPVCSGNAQPEITSDSCLIVWHKDGSIAEFELKEKPKIIFLDNRVEVITSSLKVEYDFSAIEKMTYELKTTDAIPEIASDDGSTPFVTDGGYIKFFSSEKDLNIKIFSLNGTLIKQHFAKRNESYSFPLHALPKGVYLIRVNNITNKISIK